MIVLVMGIMLIYIIYVNYNKREAFSSPSDMIHFPTGYDTEDVWMENRNYVPFIANECLDTFVKKDMETSVKVCRTCTLGEMGLHII